MNMLEIFGLIFVILFAIFAMDVPTGVASVALAGNCPDGEPPDLTQVYPGGGYSDHLGTSPGNPGGD